MHPVAIIFLAACCGSLVLTVREDAMTHALAWLMFSIWGCANLLWVGDHMEALAAFDLPVAMISYALLCVEPTRWRFVLAVAFAFRMTLHVPGAWGMMPRDIYLHWINAAFLAALVAISWEGGKRAYTDTVDRVRRFRGLGIRAAESRALVVSPA